MLDSNDFIEQRQQILLKLTLVHGSFNDEVPEQFMSVMFIQPDDVVLEIGGNVGRNSCVISSILNDSTNLVVIESSVDEAKKLQENRDVNHLQFHIENSAISPMKMYQYRDMTRQVCFIDPTNLHVWTEVQTITYPDLKMKYNKNFNVLVVDCEGALMFILRDFPEIMNGIEKIIIENDFFNLHSYPPMFFPDDKEYVDTVFKNHGLKRVYVKGFECPCRNGPDTLMCEWCKSFVFRDNFYEAWSK